MAGDPAIPETGFNPVGTLNRTMDSDRRHSAEDEAAQLCHVGLVGLHQAICRVDFGSPNPNEPLGPHVGDAQPKISFANGRDRKRKEIAGIARRAGAAEEFGLCAVPLALVSDPKAA